jgi:hypothetical protein
LNIVNTQTISIRQSGPGAVLDKGEPIRYELNEIRVLVLEANS